MPRVSVVDLSGSLNQGVAPSEIASNEYAAISNWFQFGSRLRRRGGMKRITNDPFTEPITGMTYFAPESIPVGGVDMLVASSTLWGRLSGDAITELSPESGFSIPSSMRRWSMFQYKNIAYGLRAEIGLVRSDGVSVGPGGIAAPDTAATLADGDPGDIPAAGFVGVYTYYNSATNLESNPSPASNVLSHAGSKKIDWTGITTSINAQVTSRRLYRSLPDQSGEYFMVAEIANNTDTTYTGDNVLAQDLGDAASFTNDVPPEGLLFGDVYKERLFSSDGRLLYHSEDGTPEAYDPDGFFPITPDDGHEIRGVKAHGDRLMIGQTNRMDYLTGSGPSTFQLLTLSDRHGCVSHHSMQVAEGLLFWLGPDNVYRSDGNSVIGIASVKLRTIIENMDDEAAHNSFATVFAELGWYVLTVPGYAQLIYNYRTDAWTTVPTATDINMLGDHFTDEQVQEIYASDDAGHVYQFNDMTYGYDDDDADTRIAIEASFDTRELGPEAIQGGVPGSVCVVTRAGLLSEAYAATIDMSILSAGVALKARTGLDLNIESQWKIYALSTLAGAKTRNQLRVTYSGVPFVELEGWFLDLEPIARSSMLSR